MRRLTIQELAAATIAAADRSHLEPPAMEPSVFRRPNIYAPKRVTCYRYRSNLLDLLPPVKPFCVVRELDRQNKHVVEFLAAEKAYRESLGMWSANIIEERLERCLNATH